MKDINGVEIQLGAKAVAPFRLRAGYFLGGFGFNGICSGCERSISIARSTILRMGTPRSAAVIRNQWCMSLGISAFRYASSTFGSAFFLGIKETLLKDFTLAISI